LRFFSTVTSLKEEKLPFFILRVRLSPVTWKRAEVKCESLIIIGTLDLTPLPPGNNIGSPLYCLFCNSDGQYREICQVGNGTSGSMMHQVTRHALYVVLLLE
jgi:hypothetical protein